VARKIKARSLGKLLARYLDERPEAAAGHVADCDPEEGAELLELLPEARAWSLLRRLPPSAARRWLEHSPDEGLRRLIRQASPQGPLPADQDRQALEAAAVNLLSA
jgi:hypothetical protein